MSKLKPCPFCGGEAAIMEKYTILAKYYQPYCIKCSCKQGNFLIRKEAVEAWNRRNTDEQN